MINEQLSNPYLEVSEKYKGDLVGIFGKAAEISSLENERFCVQVQLEDGILPGGQQVKLILYKEKNIEGMSSVNKDGYRLNQLEINGQMINTKHFVDTYFIPRVTVDERLYNPDGAEDWKSVEKYIKNAEHTQNHLTLHNYLSYGTYYDPEINMVVMRIFTNADDIFALFHEQGHAQINTIQTEGTKARNSFSYMFPENNDIQSQNEVIARWKNIVTSEVDADNFATNMFVLNKQAIFSIDDVSWMPRIDKLIQQHLSNYVMVDDGKFAKAVGTDVVKELTKTAASSYM